MSIKKLLFRKKNVIFTLGGINMHNYFSSNIKFLRENSGMSKTDLANKLKVHQSTISRWENGDMGVTVDNAYDVSNIFNICVFLDSF